MKFRKNLLIPLMAVLALAALIISVDSSDYTEAAPSAILNEITRDTDYTSLPYYKQENAGRYENYKAAHPNCSWPDVITYVNIGLDHDFYTQVDSVAKPESYGVLVNKYHSLSSSYIPQDLKTISSKYSRSGQRLRSAAKTAFETMCADAAKQGLTIKAVSAYRSYYTQDRVYYSKVDANDPAAQEERNKYSAKAGYSEHQLGLAVDVSSLTENLDKTAEFKWYSQNAHKYGFIIRYPKAKQAITGYSYEPWHLRYLGVKLATAVYNSGLTYDEYFARFLDKSVKAENEITVLNLNGASTLVNSYIISGNTYFKLRDLAQCLNGTAKKFAVGWDKKHNCIALLSAHSYQPVGGELALPDEATNQTAWPSDATVYLNGQATAIKAYTIAGSNYFRLQDLASALDFGLKYDEAASAINIETTSSYTDQN